MNLDQYPIYFPYNAISAPYSPSRPHKGNDYALQQGDPIIIKGTKIGLTGQTGWTDGPHVHVQAGRDEWAQSPINPSPYVGKPGTVVKTGYGDQWGNYVCIRVGDVNVFYCHMSQIIASVGQIIGGEEIMEVGDIKNFTSAVFQVKADANDLAQAGKPWKTVMYYLADKYQKPIALWKRQGVLDQNDIKNFAKAVFKTTATADDLKLASLGWKEGMYALATKYQNNIVSVNKEPSSEAEQKIKKIKEIIG